MATDTTYKPTPLVFSSHGIVARPALDRSPWGTYLNLLSAEERVEEALSSRLGTRIINRDPDGTIGGVNYFLPNPITMLARLKALTGQIYRYANSGNVLYRRAGDGQGPYSPIFTGLSGAPFSSLTASSFQSALPYLMVYDAAASIKDNGTGTPSQIGIFGPRYPATVIADAPNISTPGAVIESFQSSGGFTTAGFTISGLSAVGSVTGQAGAALLNLIRYNCPDASVKIAQSGMIGKSSNNHLELIFNVQQDTSQFDTTGINGAPVTPNDTFSFTSVSGSIGSSAVGTIGKSFGSPRDFSSYDDQDLFILAFKVSNPSAVQEIRLMFDVNGTNYTSSYYYKSITPVSYQGGISLPAVTDPAAAVAAEVFARATGISNLSQVGSAATNITPPDDPAISQVQPQQMTTGAGSWSVVLVPKGSFVAVGNAGEPGLDWSNITSWQVQITTNPQGSTNVAFNALYIQSGGGPSSYGGIGYDLRYTYYDAATGAESNPSEAQLFAITSTNPTGSSLLFPLRQALVMFGIYSVDPQVTHVRVYSKGGVLGDTWRKVDQFVNITAGGTFSYRDTSSDSTIEQGDPLQLDNDVPVTSTLQNPISTTLTAPLVPNIVLLQPVQPINVIVTDPTAVFVPHQIVVIGNPENLEQVKVIVGGTGSFTGCVQLNHAADEPVQVFAKPAVPCNVAAEAYGQYWLAGDPNNPGALYYNKRSFPESFPPQNRIAVGTASDPIMAVINFRGTLFVATLTTWYQIFPGPPPYAKTTGSKHGLVANFAWTQTETVIPYLSHDGIRMFRGADGEYLTLPIEWLFQNINQDKTPISELDLAQISNCQMAFWNNIIFFTYIGQDGKRHRLMYHTLYKRFRNDDIPATTLLLEEDTNTLLFAQSLQGAYAIEQDRVGDYDDGGWVGGVLQQLPITFNIQTPYQDLGAPNNPKQFNVFDLDVNPNGETLTLTLFWDDGGIITPTILPAFTGSTRQKIQFVLNGGDGQQAYRVSIGISGSVLHAPTIYQAAFHAAVLPEYVKSFDTYWIKFGTDESELVKQGYVDYTSTAPITIQLFADGNTSPYYQVTLPTNPARFNTPKRFRFPARKPRLWRFVATSQQPFQFWIAPQIDAKPICDGKSYERRELVVP